MTLRAWPGSSPPSAQLRAWRAVDIGIVFVIHREATASLHPWALTIHVVFLRLKETLIWGGETLPLGPLLFVPKGELRRAERAQAPGKTNLVFSYLAARLCPSVVPALFLTR